MRILIIRFGSFGDCILLCPLAAALKAAGAEEVAVVTKRAWVELFSAATGVDRVIALEPSGGIAALENIARAHRGRGFLVIDAHNNWRSRFLSWRLGGAASRFQKHYAARLALIVLKRAARIPTMLGQYARLGAPAGLDGALHPGGISVPDPIADRIEDDASGRPTIAVAPGSRWPMKRWPEDAWGELAARVAQRSHLVLVGDDSDRAAAAPLAAALGDRATDLTGRLSLMETAAWIRRSDAFVGNDSGLMHLAESLGTPVVGVFGPTVEGFGYYPALEASRTVERSLACRPCSRNGAVPCPRGTHECMTGITVDAVESALASLLDGSGPRRIVLEGDA
jgi:heptosyltransferase-2